MAFVTVPTFLDGIAFLTADGNQYIRDNINYLKGQAGAIYLENALEIAESATPATPASGRSRIYIGNASPLNGIAACVDDAGAVYQMVPYSTGTWTPTYQGATTGGTTTYSTQSGEYTRIGDICIARGVLIWTNATGTGNARLSLPFTATGASYTAGSVYLDSVTFTTTTPLMLLTTGQAFVLLGSPASNGGTTVVNMEVAGTIVYTIVYKV